MSSNDSRSESFEQALERLEALTRALEDPGTGLDEAIDLYEKGTVLAKDCMDRLAAAELRVEKLQQRMMTPPEQELPGGSDGAAYTDALPPGPQSRKASGSQPASDSDTSTLFPDIA